VDQKKKKTEHKKPYCMHVFHHCLILIFIVPYHMAEVDSQSKHPCFNFTLARLVGV